MDSASWHEARQDNDGDCLCASLAVIGSVCGFTSTLREPPVLIGDGTTMRTMLAAYVEERCVKDAKVKGADIAWRCFVETEFDMRWSECISLMNKSAVYHGNLLQEMGTFMGLVFVKAFEEMYEYPITIYSRDGNKYEPIFERSDVDHHPVVGLLRKFQHYDVLVADTILEKGWTLQTRGSKRNKNRTIVQYSCAKCATFKGTYRETLDHEKTCEKGLSQRIN